MLTLCAHVVQDYSSDVILWRRAFEEEFDGVVGSKSYWSGTWRNPALEHIRRNDAWDQRAFRTNRWRRDSVHVSFLLLLLLMRRSPLGTFPLRYLLVGSALFVAYELSFALALGLAKTREAAIEVAMVNYLWPGLTVFCAAVVERRRLRARVLVGLLLAFAGVVVSSSGGATSTFAGLLSRVSTNAPSYILAFLAAVVWALYCVATRKLAQGKDGLWLFMGQSAVGFWVLYALDPHAQVLRFNAGGLLQVLLAGAAGAAGYALWNAGILRGNMNLLALAGNSTPLLTQDLVCREFVRARWSYLV